MIAGAVRCSRYHHNGRPHGLYRDSHFLSLYDQIVHECRARDQHELCIFNVERRLIHQSMSNTLCIAGIAVQSRLAKLEGKEEVGHSFLAKFFFKLPRIAESPDESRQRNTDEKDVESHCYVVHQQWGFRCTCRQRRSNRP